jgi:hypothetical protein
MGSNSFGHRLARQVSGLTEHKPLTTTRDLPQAARSATHRLQPDSTGSSDHQLAAGAADSRMPSGTASSLTPLGQVAVSWPMSQREDILQTAFFTASQYNTPTFHCFTVQHANHSPTHLAIVSSFFDNNAVDQGSVTPQRVSARG